MNIGRVGKSGEDMVAAFLRKNGYKIAKRNYSCRFGEIDIIAERNGKFKEAGKNNSHGRGLYL